MFNFWLTQEVTLVDVSHVHQSFIPYADATFPDNTWGYHAYYSATKSNIIQIVWNLYVTYSSVCITAIRSYPVSSECNCNAQCTRSNDTISSVLTHRASLCHTGCASPWCKRTVILCFLHTHTHTRIWQTCSIATAPLIFTLLCFSGLTVVSAARLEKTVPCIGTVASCLFIAPQKLIHFVYFIVI
jgi:hypothetical protein